jgi:hypothetical protein
MYAVTAETPPSGQARHTHFRSYRGNLTMWAGKAHPFTYLPWKPEDVYACVLQFRSGAAVIAKTRLMCMYVYYTVVLVPGEPLRS